MGQVAATTQTQLMEARRKFHYTQKTLSRPLTDAMKGLREGVSSSSGAGRDGRLLFFVSPFPG